MKILLIQNNTYVPARGGSTKSNRILIEELAARNHDCQVITLALNQHIIPRTRSEFLYELGVEGIPLTRSHVGIDVFHHKGVEVHAATDISVLDNYVLKRISEFEPACILVSSEDPDHQLLWAALEASSSRVVFLARTTFSLPFGPDSACVNSARTAMFGQAAGIVTTSNYLENYIRKWTGLEPVTLPISLYGSGPFPRFGCFDSGFVTLINPCAYKGISIFIELAMHLPEVQFAAVPSWGTTEADVEVLSRLPNVQLLEPTTDIDKIYAQTRVLLVPSLCAEAFGRVVIEGMLRGIPVLSSNMGGLPEAKMGVDYVLPVRSIECFEKSLDSKGLPMAVVPEQDIRPWVNALRELLSDRMRYRQVSMHSLEASLDYVSNLSVAPLESYLEDLISTPQMDPGCNERQE